MPTDLTDEQISAFIADPATIPTHAIALEVMAVLDEEIADITVQIDAARAEAAVCPLSKGREDWLRRACYAAAMRRRDHQNVYRRDKEIRGMKGPATTPPRVSGDEKAAKELRLRAEAEDRRAKRQIEIETLKTRQMELAQEKRNNPLRAEIERLRAKLDESKQ